MSLTLINDVTFMTDNSNIKLLQSFWSQRIGTYDGLGGKHPLAAFFACSNQRP